MKQTTMRLVGAGLVALLAAGCTATASQMTPSASVTTAVQGWERYFRIESAVQPTPTGATIDGYLYNTYGTPAANVQVLAQALDATGNVVGQKLEWVPGLVPPLNRTFFRVPGLPPAPQYRVAVWGFDWVEGGFPQR